MTRDDPRRELDAVEQTAQRLRAREERLVAALQRAYGYVPDDVAAAVKDGVYGADADREQHLHSRDTVRRPDVGSDARPTPIDRPGRRR